MIYDETRKLMEDANEYAQKSKQHAAIAIVKAILALIHKLDTLEETIGSAE